MFATGRLLFLVLCCNVLCCVPYDAGLVLKGLVERVECLYYHGVFLGYKCGIGVRQGTGFNSKEGLVVNSGSNVKVGYYMPKGAVVNGGMVVKPGICVLKRGRTFSRVSVPVVRRKFARTGRAMVRSSM